MKRKLMKSLGFKKSLRTISRREFAMSYYSPILKIIDQWAPRDTENTNFYYDLTEICRDQLAQLIACVTGKTYSEILSYFLELESDEELRQHLMQGLVSSNYGTDIEIQYGRRLGWYAFVRSMKPKTVVETGVDHGVGACVLSSALLLNASEGYSGHYIGTEIRPEAGKLFSGKYKSIGEILYGDSIESLKNYNGSIDLLINDSDHSSEYEYREYLTVKNKLSENAIILGDNSHVTQELSKFSNETGRNFLFFSEKPKDHWYPGAGIGVSFNRVLADVE